MTKATKRVCEICDKPTRRIHTDRNKRLLCYNCFRKGLTIIQCGPTSKGVSLEKAKSKVYSVKTYHRINKEGHPYICCTSSFPSVLSNRKFKIQLVE